MRDLIDYLDFWFGDATASVVARLAYPPDTVKHSCVPRCYLIDTPIPVRQSALCLSGEPPRRLASNGVPYLFI